MQPIRKSPLLLIGAVLWFVGMAATASAASITIVALGTSNSKGRGVTPQQSWPSQLQAMLRARGVDARVINMGVNGDSTAGMLARAGSVPNGTRLVILEWARNNEARNGIDNTSANMAAIRDKLSARNIASIDITGVISAEFPRARAAGMIVNDGGPHLNGAAYTEVASQVLPMVMSQIGR